MVWAFGVRRYLECAGEVPTCRDDDGALDNNLSAKRSKAVSPLRPGSPAWQPRWGGQFATALQIRAGSSRSQPAVPALRDRRARQSAAELSQDAWPSAR